VGPAVIDRYLLPAGPTAANRRFGEVRERSLSPLVADCYQTMSDVERTVKQLAFTSASEVVARKVDHTTRHLQCIKR